MQASIKPLVAVACGGTGGHLFPGIAVAEVLSERGCDIVLLVSAKEVDQEAVRGLEGIDVAVLPAVGMESGRLIQFMSGCWKSWGTTRSCFRARLPQGVLGMGGFTCTAPILAGKAAGATTFLHESNTIPGRANRWLGRVVDAAFAGFPQAARKWLGARVEVTGTPVRSALQQAPPAGECRTRLGLHASRPVLLIMGGSQGAEGINDLILRGLPILMEAAPELQFLHLTGPADCERVSRAYAGLGAPGIVRPFVREMDVVLGAATAAISRAGASSLAEFAAVRLPAVLIPYPSAADDHQRFNAMAFAEAGGATWLNQATATPELLAGLGLSLIQDTQRREGMREALAACHSPLAARTIADKMIALMRVQHPRYWSDGSAAAGPDERAPGRGAKPNMASQGAS